MKLSDYDYKLPKKLIAQKPIKPRDHSRLLILDKTAGKIEHKHFYNIVDCFKKGDVLVLNNSKVFPARLIGKKVETGGKIEIFLLRRLINKRWKCLIGGRGSKEGLEIKFNNKLRCKIIKDNINGTWEVKFNKSYKEIMEIVARIGQVPLPPYIKKKLSLRDKKDYQTIYADDKKTGSVAAPTAGFHFTPSLIKKIKKKGVQFEYVTLHVGLGTFLPVKTENIKKHKMHSEMVEIKKDTANRILKAKKKKRRIIAVGTTSARTLEGVISKTRGKVKNDIKESTEIFIYPGYKFKIVDAMITNFHLPKSTLLMLVSAFTSKKNINKAYKEAIKKKYRFFSYGDAMLLI